MMKKIGIGLFLTLGGIYAQTELDILRVSRYNVISDAKSVAMSDANVGIGGDFGSLVYNPASIGVLNSFKAQGSVLFSGLRHNNTYVDNQSTYQDPSVVFSNFGIAAGLNVGEKDPFIRVNVAYGNNLLMDFNRFNRYSGTQDRHSQLDDFVGAANGIAPISLYDVRPFDADLAYYAYLINPLDTINNTYDNELFYYPEVYQERSVDERGTLRQNALAIAANIDDKFYLGFSLNIFNLDYFRRTLHMERAQDDNVSWSSYEYREDLTQRGSGVNLNLGMMYRPVDALKIGFWYNSRASIKVSETYETEIKSSLRDGSRYEVLSPIGEYAYRMVLPHRLGASFAYQVQKRFSFSFAYEMAMYRTALYRENFLRPGFYEETNEVIDEVFQSGHHLRVGLEYRLHPIFAVRLGAAYQTSPWKSEYSNVDNNALLVSGGFGLKGKSFYLDFGLMNRILQEETYMYANVGSDYVKTALSQWNGVVTLGFRMK